MQNVYKINFKLDLIVLLLSRKLNLLPPNRAELTRDRNRVTHHKSKCDDLRKIKFFFFPLPYLFRSSSRDK